MANTTTLNLDPTNYTKIVAANPLAARTPRTITLSYDVTEIVWSLPPQNTVSGYTVAAIWIGGKRYSTPSEWTAAWLRAYNTNRANGVKVLTAGSRPSVVSASNLTITSGAKLTNSTVTTTAAVATTAAVTSVAATPSGPTGLPGPRGVDGVKGDRGDDGVGIGTVTLNAEGDLIVTLDDTTVINAGSVKSSLSIGTVTTGSVAGASISGAADDQTLDLVFLNTEGLGLGNVTNESKLTMFTSPTFTGIPVAPTAAAGTNTTQIATTQYVRTEVANLVSSAPGALDTLDELAAALGDDASYAATITTALGLKAPVNNPTFTGTVGGISATMVGLGNVTNESKLTMFSSPTFTGTVSGVTATHVGLGNVTNESKATMFTDPTFTGSVTAPTLLIVPGGFSITQVGTKLLFQYNGNTIASMDSTGNIISAANVTAYGTP
jgi:hypothetical protein